MQNEIQVSPVAAIEVGTVQQVGKVILGLQGLQRDGSVQTQRYLLEPQQAREMARLLVEKASRVEEAQNALHAQSPKH